MKIENTHITIGIFIVIGIIILLYIFNKLPIPNEGIVYDNTQSEQVNNLIDKLTEEENEQHSMIADEDVIDGATMDKFKWKNQNPSALTNEKRVNYAEGDRGSPTEEWDNFYKTNTDLIDKSYIQNNAEFVPMDETKGNFSAYQGRQKEKHTPDDLFKVGKLLPQETNPAWFEVMPEPIKVKNRHLVNVTRPIGVNTIGSSLKNASHDLRGSPPCPKFVVSPWMQSSIEPDLNIMGLN